MFLKYLLVLDPPELQNLCQSPRLFSTTESDGRQNVKVLECFGRHVDGSAPARHRRCRSMVSASQQQRPLQKPVSDVISHSARLPRAAPSGGGGGLDCLQAGDACSADDGCSPRLRTLRQCVAGDGSVKLGPGARSQCESAMTALLATPLHGCQCKRGMKREKNCLSIYWSLQQSVLHGLSLVQNFPYEPEERGSDYVRLASIAAGETETGFHQDGGVRLERQKGALAGSLVVCGSS
ncbi:GDNF family receptor alpha-1-like [Nelusetta ayraudi]|uniref:GDNF family receptor alpha-1-like n=1 Tax=Nelusetta ayraudi TaxID=303726 RepID=UPI003F706EFA